MYKIHKKKGFTIVEVIIATLLFSIIFASLIPAIILVSNYIKKSNVQLSAMNLTKSGIEKIHALKTKKYIQSNQDTWGDFIKSYQTGYFVFSGSDLLPKNDDNIIDFSHWEGPLDASGDPKTNTDGVSFYRLVTLADFDVDSEDQNTSIFDCKSNGCSPGVTKKYISLPYLSNSMLSGTTLELTFSGGAPFVTPSIFVVYGGDQNAPYTLESTMGNVSTGILPHIGPVMYIDFSSFSGSAYTGLSGKDITLSGSTSKGTLKFGDNLNLDENLDTAIFNLRNSIGENFEDFNAFILYPNICTLGENFVMYDISKDTNFTLPRDNLSKCDATNITTSPSSITLSGSHIGGYTTEMTIKPQYTFKIQKSGDTTTGYKLFSNLQSLRVPHFGIKLGEKGFSSIYNAGIRVVGIENGQVQADEVIQSYLTDTEY